MGVADPRDETRTVATALLHNQALSTSGDSESLTTHTGERICHIFDPRTGQPFTRLGSVSVLSTDATTGEAFATAFFVNGEAWTENYCHKNPTLEALFVEPQPETATPRLAWCGTHTSHFHLVQEN